MLNRLDQQRVENLDRIIAMRNDQSSTRRCKGCEFGVRNLDARAARHSDNERLEGRLSHHLPDSVNAHAPNIPYSA